MRKFISPMRAGIKAKSVYKKFCASLSVMDSWLNWQNVTELEIRLILFPQTIKDPHKCWGLNSTSRRELLCLLGQQTEDGTWSTSTPMWGNRGSGNSLAVVCRKQLSSRKLNWRVWTYHFWVCNKTPSLCLRCCISRCVQVANFRYGF